MKNKITTYLFIAFGVMLALSGCRKVEDLYKGTDKQTSPLFSDSQGIPTDFNWSMIKSVDVRIAVNDRFNGQYFYKVELFDNDPVFGSGANLLGAGQAKQGQDFVNQIVVPTALEYVYMKTTSPVGIAAVSMISVKEVSSVNVQASTASGQRAASTGRSQVDSRAASGFSMSNLSASTFTTLNVQAPTAPEGAKVLEGSNNYGWNDISAHKNFVVKAGTKFTGTVDLNSSIGGIKVYVEGTWERSENITLGNNNAIYVLPGGRLKVTNKLEQSNQGFFENYGTAEIKNMPVTGSTVAYKNYGSLAVDQSALSSGGKFFNYGTATFENLTTQSNGTIIRNEGSLTVKNGNITGNSHVADPLPVIEAVCHTVFETLKTNGAKLYVTNGALFSVGNLEADGTHIYLASSSIFDVTVLAKFGNSSNYMYGSENGTWAVARLKKVNASGWHSINYSRNLEVASSDHTANGQHFFYYTISSPAVIRPYDQSEVTINATPCNAGGNNDAGAGTNPDDQTVTAVNLGTYSYAFEDNWPSFGDYDMNDFVTDMAITKFQNAANKVTKVELKARLRSVGASKRMVAAVQLDGVHAANVKSVTYSRSDLVGSGLPLTPTGIEVGQTYAVVPICDDAHKAFGVSDVQFISTQNGNFAPVDVVITLEFNTPLEQFTHTTLNVFIINFLQNAGGRNEIHLVGYKPTDKMNKSLVAYQTETTGQLTVGDPFKSHDGYPWGLCIPASFVYPPEGKNISDIYPRFRSWAESGGVENADWYVK